MPRAEAAVPLLEVVGESVEVADAPAGAASGHADAPALEPEQPQAGGGGDLSIGVEDPRQPRVAFDAQHHNALLEAAIAAAAAPAPAPGCGCGARYNSPSA